MKICIAVNFLQELTGSELLAIELANEFARTGHSVDVLAYSLDEAFAQSQLDSRVNYYSDLDVYDYCDVDLYYFQHQMGSVVVPILRDCFENGQIFIWPYLIFSHISLNFGFETPGPFTETLFADEMWCNSEETKQHLITNYGNKFMGADVFHNAAPIEYETVEAVRDTKKLKQILAVSNHFPEEIIQALEILESKGVEVLRRGKQFETKKITTDTLAANQAVLTIGKTAQYALRAGRAVYCYDIHGGPGWLDENNFEASAFHNFSGRSNPRQLEAEQIADELMKGYSSSIQFSKSLTASQLDRFKLELLVEKTIEKAEHRLKSVKRNSEFRKWALNPHVKGDLNQEYNISFSLMDYAINSESSLNHIEYLEAQCADLMASQTKLNAQNARLKKQRDKLKAQIKRLTDKKKK